METLFLLIKILGAAAGGAHGFRVWFQNAQANLKPDRKWINGFLSSSLMGAFLVVSFAAAGWGVGELAQQVLAVNEERHSIIQIPPE